MKKLALTSLLAVFAATAASAATTPYVAAHIGYDAPSVTIYENHTHMAEYFNSNNDFAYDLSIAAGVKHDLNSMFALRAELEYDFMGGFVGHWQDEEEGVDFRIHNHTALLNGYFDMKTASALTPYIGAGIGYQWNHVALPEEAYKPHAFAWQVGGGVSYALCDHVSFDLGYRYLSSVDKNFDETPVEKWKVANHQFRLGAAYAF